MLSSLYLKSDGAAPALRIGLVVGGDVLPRHYVAVIDDLLACDFATLELVVARASPADAGKAVADRGGFGQLLYRMYERREARRVARCGPLAPTDASVRLAGVARVEVAPVRSGSREELPADVLEAVRNARLDVVLDLDPQRLGRALQGCARHGVWSYRWGALERRGIGPPHVWELVEEDAVTGAALEARTAEGAFTLCETLDRTSPTVSAARNRAALLAETTHFVVWKLHDLHRGGWQALRAVATAEREPAAGAGRRVPSNGQMLRFVAKRSAARATAAVSGLCRYRGWKVGLRIGATPLHDPAGGTDLRDFRWLEAPHGHYWADPFVVPWRGRHFLFVEDFLYDQRFHLRALELRDGHGVISCAEILPSGELGPMQVVLDTGKHLSYPMVFAAGDEMYLIPESGQAHEVALYRATRFPYAWAKEAVLFDRCRAADTTVLEHEGTWYFLTTLSDGNSSLKLMLFYADSLTGPWQYHPASPISSDVRNCRCAGPIVRRGGRLLRPSQSCAPEYGYSFTLNEIVELSRTRYRERPWRTVEPDPALGMLGTHQYSEAGGIEVTDACVWTPVRHQDAHSAALEPVALERGLVGLAVP